MVNDQNIFYSKKGLDTYIGLSQIKGYSQAGKRNSGVIAKSFAKMMDTVTVADEFRYIRTCMGRAHGEYMVGAFISALGIGVTGTSFFLKTEGNETLALAGAGTVLIFIGGIVMFDSHKWFKRASYGVSGKGNSVNIYYKF